MKKQPNARKAFTMLELIFVIVVIGALATFGMKKISGQGNTVKDTSSITNITEATQSALLQYKDDNYQNTNDYSNLTPTNAEAFFDSKYFTLTGGVIVPNDFLSAKIDFLPAPNSLGTNNATFKIMYDFSAVKTEKHWSDQEAMRFETRIASFYTGVAKTTIVGGSATSLGSANADIAASVPNSDGIIVVQYAR